MRYLFYFFILIFCSTNLFAQGHHFRRYQVENGLSNNTILCSLQDKNGFLWLGTKDGLNRFDGYSFKIFRHDPEVKSSISSNYITSLFIDSKGMLWVGTNNGIHQYNEETECFKLIDDTKNQYIRTIEEDKNGNIWMIAGGRIAAYDRQQKKIVQNNYNIPATFLCFSPNGTLWVASNNGLLYQYIANKNAFISFDVFKHSEWNRSKQIEVIYSNNDSAVLIGTISGGAKVFDVANKDYRDLLTYNPDRTDIFVRDIIHNTASEYWFATESGIFIYDLQTNDYVNLKKKYTDPYSISDNAVYTLCKDKEGGVWAGTFFGGINYYPRQNFVFQKYFPDYTNHSLSGNAVRIICKDNFGNLWMGTEDAGINCMEDSKPTFTHYLPDGTTSSISYYNIHGLAAIGNELWIGTFEHGLDVMDIRTRKVVRHYKAGNSERSLKSNFIFDIYQTRDEKILIATTSGCYYYNKASDDFTPIPQLSTYTYCFAEDNEGRIWTGTSSSGAVFYNPKTGESGQLNYNPADKNSISNNNINSLFIDSRNTIWFCTEGGGICNYNPATKKIQRYTSKEGMPSDFVFKALEDDQKRIWITSSKGLVCLDPATNNLKIFTTANGLLNDQFNYNSGFKDSTGRLYFGSVRGMVSFNPNEFKTTNFIPPVYITGFQVNNKELVIDKKNSPLSQSLLHTKSIELPYDQSSFSIDFAAISFTAPQVTEYKYMMEGLDKDWTYIKSNRKVYFTNLAPGKYTFKLKAAVNGLWSEKEKTLVINITPPIWATSWAYLIYITIACVILYYLFRIYHERHEAKKEKEIYEAKIDFFTKVAHEIRTPLTLIKGPVENLTEIADDLPRIKEDVVTMERNTNRLLKLINQILDFRKTETKGFSLDFSEVELTSLLREVYLSFQAVAKKKGLKYTIEFATTELIISADAEALLKIFSNLFSNAVKYAEKEVRIKLLTVKEGDEAVAIEVQNDGYLIPEEMKEQIFEPFYRIKATAKEKGTGIGLSLARSLTELHEGELYVSHTEKGWNTFVVNIPVNRTEGRKRKKLFKKSNTYKG